MSELIQCPLCKEDIKAGAIKCKHCGTILQQDVPFLTTTPAPAVGGLTTGVPRSPTGVPGGTPAWWMLAGPLAPGTTVREYRVDKMLGQGGMGEVYLGTHVLTGQRVAIKVVSPELTRDEGIRRRFLEEARVMAEMRHSNIVQLLAFFEEGNRFFLVMEFIDGETLDDMLERTVLTVEDSVRIGLGVLGGLRFAHTRPNPIIHRDIKPANVLLGRDGRVVITDFGVAKAIGREKMTRTRGVVGTYEYMSPEQARGDEVSPASDVYSFGIMFYRMLTGVVPFPQKSDTGIECLRGHLEQPIPALHEFREGLPTWVQPLVEKALAKDPQSRFRTADEMERALQSGLAGRLDLQPAASAGPLPQPKPATGPSAPSRPASPPPAKGAAGGSGTAPQPPPSAQDAGAPGGKRSLTGLWVGLAAVLVLGGGGFGLWKGGMFGGGSGGQPEKAGNIEKIEQKTAQGPEAAKAIACVRLCDGKSCGDDGCGGTCGECASGRNCQGGVCVCQFSECGGQCCNRGDACSSGRCCTPSCINRDCGDDGCGGRCGSCSGGKVCMGNSCQVPDIGQLWGSMKASAWNYQQSNPERYNPSNLSDMDSETAWCKDNGVGQWVELELGSPTYLFSLQVQNGFQKAAAGLGDPFQLNSRVESAKLVFSDGTSKTVRLTDTRGWQQVDLGGVHSGKLRLVVESAYRGRDKTICLSGLRLEGAR